MKRKLWSVALVHAAVALFVVTTLKGTEKRRLLVQDCVCVRSLVENELKVSPLGDQVAYLVKAPDVMNNTNNYELWVRELKGNAGRSNGRMLLKAEEAGGISWLADNKRLALLTQESGRSKIVFVDANTGMIQTVWESEDRIESFLFTVSASGTAIAYPIPISNSAAGIADGKGGNNAPYGYPIPLGYPASKARQEFGRLGRQEVNVIRQNSTGKWELEKISGQASRQTEVKPETRTFKIVSTPALSPDGNYLAFNYYLDPSEVPTAWQQHRYVRMLSERFGGTPEALVLYNLKTRELRRIFDSPFVRQPIRWSDDSRALVVAGVPPIGSSWDDEYSLEESPALEEHFFTISISDLAVSEIQPPTASDLNAQRFWHRELIGAIVSWKQSDGEMLVQRDTHTYARLRRNDHEWREVSHFAVTRESQGSGLASANSEGLVGVEENGTTPPDLFQYEFGTGKSWVLTDLNRGMREVSLGEVSEAEWSNRYGSKTKSYLIKPVGYAVGKKYPLVVMSYGHPGQFLCGSSFPTGFPVQPLANAGFLVLYLEQPHGKAPKEYKESAGLWEFDDWVATVEDSVESLVKSGIADPNKVGLIGWSRTSAKVDYLITHSKMKIAASSSIDGGAWNYGDYWLWQNAWGEVESVYGGPPYGSSMANWIQYSPPFNADKVEGPLLMQYMGEKGIHPEPKDAYEFFTALHRQGKPVELYFYPQGEHVLDKPFERVASLQRTVDWFLFWIESIENKAPDYDTEQYVRWRKLREQKDWNDRMRAQGKDPVKEFLRQTTLGAILGETDKAPASREFLD